MDSLKNRIVPLILGIVLAYASISITGFGAAVAIPADILKPMVQVSGLLAFTVVDLLTIAVPLAAAFLGLAFFTKWVVKQPDVFFYGLLLAPMVLLQLYLMVQSQPQMLSNIIPTLPRYLVFAACFYFVARSTQRTKG